MTFRPTIRACCLMTTMTNLELVLKLELRRLERELVPAVLYSRKRCHRTL
jgi:hypothetical protein